MSSEARTIRPFSGLRPFEQALSKAKLHFGTEECPAGSSIYTDADVHGFSLRPVELEWASDDKDFQEFKTELQKGIADLVIDSSDVAIVVVAHTVYLKETDIVLSLPISKIDSLGRISHLTSSDNRPAPFRAWRHGFTVDANVLLTRSIERLPLRPWRLGTWLARSRFQVKTTHSSNRLFRPIPLDEEQRENLGLPPGTTRFVVFGDHNPLSDYDRQSEEPEFYIDADLLSELNASPASSLPSQAIQLDLALYFISAAVHSASRYLKRETPPPFEDIIGSLIYRIIKLCAGSSEEAEMKQVYNLIRSKPELVIAYAEDRIGIRNALIKNVKGADS